MSKFNITKKINLFELLGEGHEQSVLEFKPMTFADARSLEGLQPDVADLPDDATPAQKKAHAAEQNKAALAAVDKAVEFIKGKFIKGTIAGEPVVADDFSNDELPVDVINYCMKQLAGGKSEDFTKA